MRSMPSTEPTNPFCIKGQRIEWASILESRLLLRPMMLQPTCTHLFQAFGIPPWPNA